MGSRCSLEAVTPVVRGSLITEEVVQSRTIRQPKPPSIGVVNRSQEEGQRGDATSVASLPLPCTSSLASFAASPIDVPQLCSIPETQRQPSLPKVSHKASPTAACMEGSTSPLRQDDDDPLAPPICDLPSTCDMQLIDTIDTQTMESSNTGSTVRRDSRVSASTTESRSFSGASPVSDLPSVPQRISRRGSHYPGRRQQSTVLTNRPNRDGRVVSLVAVETGGTSFSGFDSQGAGFLPEQDALGLDEFLESANAAVWIGGVDPRSGLGVAGVRGGLFHADDDSAELDSHREPRDTSSFHRESETGPGKSASAATLALERLAAADEVCFLSIGMLPRAASRWDADRAVTKDEPYHQTGHSGSTPSSAKTTSTDPGRGTFYPSSVFRLECDVTT